MSAAESKRSQIEVVEPKLFASAVVDELVTLIQECVDERGRCVLVLSGGKTPGAVYRLLGLPPRVQDVPWEKVVLVWGDERWVAHDDAQSNFRMVRETLLQNIPGRGPKVLPVPTGEPEPSRGAAEYQNIVTAECGSDSPHFDILLLGVGEDGHTASLFPGSALFKSASASQFAAVPHPDGGFRITLTPSAITNAKQVLFLVTGSAKAAVVKDVIESKRSIDELPARIYEQCRGRVTWFLDSESAKGLALSRGS